MPGFLAGNTSSSDTAGTNIFSRHITRSEAIVNAAVTARYSLPFIVATITTNVPPIMRTLSEDIACYFTVRASHMRDGASRNEYADDYLRALDTLEKIEKGDITLTYTDGSAVATRSTGRFLSSEENYTPIFGRDDPKDWERDADEVDDQANARL